MDSVLTVALDRMAATKTYARQYAEIRDFLSVVADSLTRQRLALKCYEYYLHSPLNGAEEVAVTMTDSLFSPGKIHMASEVDLLNARIFAEFNRRSLLGRTAPSLTLYDEESRPRNFPSAGSGRYGVIYFYETDCPKCTVETALLSHFLEEENPNIRFYAVYTGSDEEAWRKYTAEAFHFAAPAVTVEQLWDPDCESDFPRAYGVLQTPRLFFIDKDNRILGRGLDTYALKALITGNEELHPYLYGSERSEKGFDALFSGLQPEVSVEDVRLLVKCASAMFPEKTADFRHWAGDLLYYLCRHRHQGTAYLEGAEYLADSLVAAKPELWRLPGDSLQVVGYAAQVKALAGLLPIGERAPDLRLRGRMKSPGRERTGSWNLRALGRPAFVFFYTRDCARCREMAATVDRFLSASKPGEPGAEQLNFLMIDLDRLEKRRPRKFRAVRERFDLSLLPFVFRMDREGRVLEKYVSF